MYRNFFAAYGCFLVAKFNKTHIHMQQQNICIQQKRYACNKKIYVHNKKNMYAMRVCIWTTKHFHVRQKYMRDNKFNNIYLLMQYSCELYIGALYILLMQKICSTFLFIWLLFKTHSAKVIWSGYYHVLILYRVSVLSVDYD